MGMVKILVGVKYSLQVENLSIDPKNRSILIDETPKKMGDMDKRALEEAIRIKEKHGGEVVVLCVGPKEANKILLEAYAMGADEAYLVPIEDLYDTSFVANIFSKFYKGKGPFDLVILGGASTDSFSGTLGARIASLLGIPIIPFVIKLDLRDGNIVGESVLDDGKYEYKSKLPAIITVTLEINEPRIPKLKDILRAKRKKINEISISDLGLEKVNNLVITKDVRAYEEKRKGVILDASDPSKLDEVIDKLVNYLKEEGVL